MHATRPLLEHTTFPDIERGVLNTLQVNLGYRCNQSCVHCHVNAGPQRTEMMDVETLALIPAVLTTRRINTLDLTGGAPELHPGFRGLVQEARLRSVHVIDRSNLTVMFEPGQEDLGKFLADQRVEVVASLPCYLVENVERQRGKGVFDLSIAALRQLNDFGFGQQGSGLMLNLVYNPQGPVLPPAQHRLEDDYRRELGQRFGIRFNRLLTITNMPIQRFGSTLISKGQFQPYMTLLKDNYRDDNLQRVMCRNLISVDWQGRLYDCDFNQQLGLALDQHFTPPLRHLRDLLVQDPAGAPITVADHCFGCTAGNGSSCGGELRG